MTWEPKRFDPPGYKGDGEDDEADGPCSRCEWAEWELAVWCFTVTVAWILVIVIVGAWLR